MKHHLRTLKNLLLLCILILPSSLVLAQSTKAENASNVDMSLFAGFGQHMGELQMAYGVNAAVLKNVTKSFSLGVGVGYLNNVDYGIEGGSSKSTSYIPIFARVKFKTPLAHQSNFLIECDGGCAIDENSDTGMLVSPQIGFDFKLGESGRLIAVKLMYNNAVNMNSGIWGVVLGISF